MKHHYVPQFLLSTWAESNTDKKLEVFRLDLGGVVSDRHAPKHTAYEQDLYALTRESIAGMDKQAVEVKFLKVVDNNAARVRDKLLNTGFGSLTPEDRVDWTRFLMSLRLRQPSVVQDLRIQASETLREVINNDPRQYDQLKGALDPATLEEWTDKKYPGLIENFGLSFFHELVDREEIGNKIINMKWLLWDFSGVKNELLIADHPLILTSGIDDPKCVLALPISPTKAFIATQSEQVDDLLHRQDPKSLAMRINESSLMQAKVRIYASRRDPNMRFIQNRSRLRMKN